MPTPPAAMPAHVTPPGRDGFYSYNPAGPWVNTPDPAAAAMPAALQATVAVSSARLAVMALTPESPVAAMREVLDSHECLSPVRTHTGGPTSRTKFAVLQELRNRVGLEPISPSPCRPRSQAQLRFVWRCKSTSVCNVA